MTEVYKIKYLGDLQGRNEKIQYIQENSEHREFIYLLKILLDKNTVLGVKHIPEEWYTTSIGLLGTSFKNFSTLVNYLQNNNRSNTSLEVVKDFLSTCNVNESYIYAGIITKSYKIGITGKTVNEALGYPLVNDFTLEKAAPFSEGLLDWSEGYVLGEEKYDGIRCAIFVEEGKVTSITFNGKIVSLPNIGKAVKLLCKKLGVSSIMLDGELLSITTRVSASGLVNRLIKSPSKHDDKELSFMVFHYMTVDEFKMREDPKTIQQVATDLGKWGANGYGSERLTFSTYYTLRSIDEIMSLYHKVRGNLGEGVMIKHPKANYAWKRSNSWLKVKSVYSTTLRVVGTYSAGEDTKYRGLVGGLYCETLDGHKISVGGGLSDDQRMLFLEESVIVGKLVEVRFTDINFSTDGEIFLDFPRLLGERFDKDEPDTLEQAVHEVPKYIKYKKDKK